MHEPPQPARSAEPLAGRRNPRQTIEACRSIALQFLSADGEPRSPWLVADILDLSLGGLCLLVSNDGALPLAQAIPLRLDLRAQPDFRCEQLQGSLRWFVPSGYVATLGVLFDEPLDRLPVLI